MKFKKAGVFPTLTYADREGDTLKVEVLCSTIYFHTTDKSGCGVQISAEKFNKLCAKVNKEIARQQKRGTVV